VEILTLKREREREGSYTLDFDSIKIAARKSGGNGDWSENFGAVYIY
jgi:hypothetical protein